MLNKHAVADILAVFILMIFFTVFSVTRAHAKEDNAETVVITDPSTGAGYFVDPKSNIDMTIIADIESSSEPLAYNKKSGAVGEYQLMPGVVAEFNSFLDNFSSQNGIKQVHVDINDMYSPDMAFGVASWYMNNKIPKYLRAYDIPDTLTSRIIAWNWGIGHLHKWFNKGSHWNQLPRETRNYIKKYFKEVKENESDD